MKRYVFLLALGLLVSSLSFAQTGLFLTGQTSSYLTQEMQKVNICPDGSVWALSSAGEIYVKLPNSTAFSLFGPTQAIQVTDMAGFSADSIYFVSDRALFFSARQSALQKIMIPDNDLVNNIALVQGRDNVYLESYLQKRNWLAVAGDKHLLAIFADGPADNPEIYTPVSTAIVRPQWRISNSGFKSIDLQYAYNQDDACFGAMAHAYYSKISNTSSQTLLPENGPLYSSKINCTYFEAVFNTEIDGRSETLDWWGTDQGLFLKRTSDCGLNTVRKKLSVKTNDIEEMNLFRDFFNIKFVLVATDQGLYAEPDYTVARRAASPGLSDQDIDQISLDPVGVYNGRVNSIALELQDNRCHRAVWIATENGLLRIPVNQPAVNVTGGKAHYGDLVTATGAAANGTYPLCNGQQYTFNAHPPSGTGNNYTVQWLMDPDFYARRVPIDSLNGRLSATFAERGEYGVRFLSDCGEIVDVGSFWLRLPELVIPDFNYPPTVSMLKGCSFTFKAKAGNDYQWEKDGSVIEGQTANTLVATLPGVYRLLYKECDDNFVKSEPVELIELDFPRPVISRSSDRSLCFGEVVTLSAPEVEGVTYLWNTGQTSREIVVSKAGNYSVDLLTASDCKKRSPTVSVVINPELKLPQPQAFKICTLRDGVLQLEGPPDFSSYNWAGGSGRQSTFTVTQPGNYALEVTDGMGCTALVNYLVIADCPPEAISNAFSPNDDGINDLWEVPSPESDPISLVKVFNRFGEVVFLGDRNHRVWDGTSHGAEVPVGIYFFLVLGPAGKTTTGSLSLIR